MIHGHTRLSVEGVEVYGVGVEKEDQTLEVVWLHDELGRKEVEVARTCRRGLLHQRGGRSARSAKLIGYYQLY